MKIFLSGLAICLLSIPCCAQESNIVTVVTDTVEFVMGSGYTAEDAYTRVIARAKRQAIVQASQTYILSYSKAENYRLSQDIVEAVQAGNIIEFSILWQNEDAEDTGVQRIVMRAKVECPSINELRRALEEKAPEALGVKNGEIYIETYPKGASIFIDGEKQTHRTPYNFHDIPEGKHDITLRLEGYRPKTIPTDISADDPQIINVLLQRPKGRIKITSNLGNATVQVDNRIIGKAPIITDDLLIGTHDVTVNNLLRKGA